MVFAVEHMIKNDLLGIWHFLWNKLLIMEHWWRYWMIWYNVTLEAGIWILLYSQYFGQLLRYLQSYTRSGEVDMATSMGPITTRHADHVIEHGQFYIS